MPQVIIKKQLPSGTILLDNATKANALTRRMVEDLRQAFNDFHSEKKVRAVILTGAGNAFCSGVDLSEIRESIDTPDAMQQWFEDVSAIRDLLETMLRFPKPIIAAVNGAARGIGGALVLASDLAVGCEATTIGFPETLRGLVAGLATPLLHFRLGGSWASQLLLTSRVIGIDEGMRSGLIHERTSFDMLWAHAHRLAEQIALAAPESIQLTKKLLNETVAEQMGALLSASAAASATARTTEAAKEGIAAFLEKREPKWPG
jgi:methylglutaconyl-CoA hydratase